LELKKRELIIFLRTKLLLTYHEAKDYAKF
jgi:hypothetical protein